MISEKTLSWALSMWTVSLCVAIALQPTPARPRTLGLGTCAEARCSAPRLSESLAVTTSKAVIGLAAPPIVSASLFSLATTGCGLRGELPGTLEGVAYTVVAGFSLLSIFSRANTGQSLQQAEIAAAKAEMGVLKAQMATAERKRLSAAKAKQLEAGPATLLGAAESACLVAAAASVLVFATELATHGSLPSSLPDTDSVCWQ
jgi:hypothetical protein